MTLCAVPSQKPSAMNAWAKALAADDRSVRSGGTNISTPTPPICPTFGSPGHVYVSVSGPLGDTKSIHCHPAACIVAETWPKRPAASGSPGITAISKRVPLKRDNCTIILACQSGVMERDVRNFSKASFASLACCSAVAASLLASSVSLLASAIEALDASASADNRAASTQSMPVSGSRR